MQSAGAEDGETAGRTTPSVQPLDSIAAETEFGPLSLPTKTVGTTLTPLCEISSKHFFCMYHIATSPGFTTTVSFSKGIEVSKKRRQKKRNSLLKS